MQSDRKKISTNKISIPAAKIKIVELQQLQKERLSKQTFTELPDDLQIEFCRTNKEIGALAYSVYKRTKNLNDQELEAASYFLLSFENHQKSRRKFELAFSNPSREIEEINAAQFSGDAQSLYKQGICYLIGIGKYPKNISMAVHLFEISAEQGYALAQNNLGYMYEKNLGVTQDYKEAHRWYLLAAEKGHKMAQNNLGGSYLDGLIIPKDYGEANKWLLLSANQGHLAAHNNLGYVYRHGKGVDKDNNKACHYYLLAAEQGGASAQVNLGYMYETGLGVTQDYHEAYRWYLLSTEQGNANAQFNIAVRYEIGGGVVKDQRTAIRWFRLAAEQHYNKAIEQLVIRKHIVGAYHAAMVHNNREKVLELLIKQETARDEFLWDIKRAIKNEALFDTVVILVQQLKMEGINIDVYALEINYIYIHKFLKNHHKKVQNNISYSENDLECFHNACSLINFNTVKEEEIKPLIEVLIDYWYAATNMGSDTNKITSYLKVLIHKLLYSQIQPSLSTYAIYQCSLILIQQCFGQKYEVLFSPDAHFDDLRILLTGIETKKSISQINQFFGKEFIKENVSLKQESWREELISPVLKLLSDYLAQNTATFSKSTYFCGLQHCFANIDINSNIHESKTLMDRLKVYTEKYQQLKKTINIFAIDDNDLDVKKIYHCLKKNLLEELKNFLEAKLEKDKLRELK